MKFTTRQMVLMSLLAAINGVLEITIGNYFHGLQFYFTGNVMIGFNCIVYITGKQAVPVRGSIIIIGFISAVIKFLFGWNINAAFAIFIEAILMELVMNITGFNITGTVLGAVSANIWALCQKIIVVGLIGGEGFFVALRTLTDKASVFFNIDKSCVFLLFLIIIMFYSLCGILFGAIGWKVTGRLRA
ncbi:MAG: hypothetical protein ABRQ37_16610 [Candidatus Eremiobacterota bacterium]